MDLSLIHKIEEAVGKFGENLLTDIIRFPNVIIFLNTDVPDEPFLNYAAVINDPNNVSTFVNEVEEIFERYKAKPNFSIAPYTSKELKGYLLDRGYEQDANNAWMFFDPNNKVPEFGVEGLEIKRVENEKEFGEFSKVMVEVFSKGEPDDPYQGLSTQWDKVLLKQYKDKRTDYQLETYLAVWNGEVVGGAQLFYDGEVSYLDWLSVLPKFRKLGIGKALQATRVNRAKELGAEYICLITEVGSRNERIFTKFGFRTEFTAQDLIRSN